MIQVRFTTTAGIAPEMKGNRCYFNPSHFEWSVSLASVMVTAVGPSTRTPRVNVGTKTWVYRGYRADPLPEWIEVPIDMIEIAETAVRALTERTDR